MRLLVLSDIHSNIDALEACLHVAPVYDHVVNLGDVVGYNASPNEVCDRVRAMNSLMVRGNHDRACAGLSDLSEFNLVAAMSARWTQITLRQDHLNWLRSLPQGPLRRDHLPGLEFVHGSPRHEDEYLLNNSAAGLDFHLTGHPDVIFFGHTHLQGGFAYKDGKTRPITPDYPQSKQGVSSTITLLTGERYLINPGSVGQPRDNDPRAGFAVYESSEDQSVSVTFYRVPYDIPLAQSRILKANLPERLATRLGLGR